MKAHALPAPVRAAARPLAAAFRCRAAFLCILALMYRTDAATGVRSGIYTCLNTLVPALFPFVLLACLLSGSRAAGLFSARSRPCCAMCSACRPARLPAIVFGLTAGYPTGAKIAASLYDGGRLTRGGMRPPALLLHRAGLRLRGLLYRDDPVRQRAHRAALLPSPACSPPLITGVCLARFAPKPVKPTMPCRRGGQRDRRRTQRRLRDGLHVRLRRRFSALLAVLHGSGLFQTLTGLLARCAASPYPMRVPPSPFLEVTAGATHSALAHRAGARRIRTRLRRRLHPHADLLLLPRRLSDAPHRLPALPPAERPARRRLLPRARVLLPGRRKRGGCGKPLARASAAGSTAASAALLALSVFFLTACVKKAAARPFKAGRALPVCPARAPIRFTNSWWKSVPQNGTMDVSLKRRPPSCSTKKRKKKRQRAVRPQH